MGPVNPRGFGSNCYRGAATRVSAKIMRWPRNWCVAGGRERLSHGASVSEVT